MSSLWDHHAKHLSELVSAKDELQAHLFLEQLMLFPVDIQDKIINEIASLGQCGTEDISRIISYYASKS